MMNNDQNNVPPATENLAQELENCRLRNGELEEKLSERDLQAIAAQKTISQLTHDLAIFEEVRSSGSADQALTGALRALKENQYLLTHMLKIAHLGYAVWDEAIDRDVFVSEEMATIHGFTKETYLSEISSLDKYIDHIHLDDQARYRAHIMDEEEVNAGVPIEYRFVTPDGDIRHLHDCNYYISVPYGEETQVIVVIQDITEHKLSQAALEESESLFRQSAEMANLGYWVWDHYKEKMVSCSKQLAQLYEMTVEETIALFSDKETEIAYIHPDDRERYEQCRLESRDRQIGMDLEFKIILPSGTVRHIYLKEDLMIGTDGKVSRSFGLEQDITKRKEAEAELARVYLEQKESEAKLKKMNQRYELAVKSSDSGIWETNLVTGERYHSPRLAEIITLDEHKDPHLDDLDSRIHWDDLDWVQDAF